MIKLKIKTLKLTDKDNFRKKLNGCRKFSNLSLKELYNENISVEYSNSPITLALLIRYFSKLGIKNLEFNLNTKGNILKTNYNKIGNDLRTIRKNKKLSQTDIIVPDRGTIVNIERSGFHSMTESYLQYAKKLEIKKLIINI